MHPYILLILYGFLAVLPVVFIIVKRNLVAGFMLWFLAVLLKDFGKIPLTMLPDLSPERVICFVLLVIVVSEIAMKQRKLVGDNTRIEVAMFLFCMYILLSKFLVGNIFMQQQGIVLSGFLSGFAIPFLMYFLAKQVFDDEQKIKKIFTFFVLIGFYLGITGIFEHYHINSLVFPKYIMNPFRGIHWGRARGPFLHGGINGMVIGMLFYIAVYLIVQTNKKYKKYFFSTSIVLMLITLVFTFTRAPWIALIVSVILIPIFYPQMRKIFVVSSLVFIMLVFTQFSWKQIKEGADSKSGRLTGDVSTLDRVAERFAAVGPIYSRIHMYAAAGKMFLEAPMMGRGFGTFKKGEVDPKYFMTIPGIPYSEYGLGSHSTWLTMLVELGLIGAAIYIFILFNIVLISVQLYYCLPRDGFVGKGLVVVFWGVFIVVAINSITREIRTAYFANSLLFFLAGIIAGLNQKYVHSKEIPKVSNS